MNISWTEYPSVYSIDQSEPRSAPWVEFLAQFSAHVRVSDKMKAPSFGPYVLQATKQPCRSHKDGQTRLAPHRCDNCVSEMTLAVFDVDTGTQDDIQKCDDLLDKANLARLWYSTYSWVPGQERPSFRLCLPFSSSLNPDEWPSVRAALIYQYSIPCLVSACKGRSHLYFKPSCQPGTEPIVFNKGSEFLRHELLPKVLAEGPRKRREVALSGWTPPNEPEPGTVIDTAPFWNVIKKRRNALSRGNGERKYKAQLLSRLIGGLALEEKGKRNDATAIVCGIMAYALSDVPISVLLGMLRPSLLSMQAAGSKLNEKECERMLYSAMRKRAESEEATKRIEMNMQNIWEQAQRSITRVT